MKRYLTTLIIGATIIIGEVHTFWEHSSVKPVNWIIARSVPMTLQQNIHIALSELNFILYGFAMLFYVPNRVNKSTAITFISFCILDTLAHFYNYKTYDYWIVYLLLIIVWPLAYLKLKKK